MKPQFVERRVGSPLWRKIVHLSRLAQGTTIRRNLDHPSWRSFGIAMVALAGALLLALYSGAAAEEGHLLIAALSAIAALALAAWVGLTIVPALARRTPLRWLSYQIDYKVTREGIFYLAGIVVVTAAAVSSGNNLLYMVLGVLLGGLLVSGMLSRLTLSAIEVRLELPEHIFAGRPLQAIAELYNAKQTMPSFSVSLVSDERPVRGKAGRAQAPRILDRPLYFPHIPHRQIARQTVELTFPRRGIYRQEALGLRTRFPFGFLEKTRQVGSGIEAVVYPPVDPTDEFYEILPLVSGELESHQRGRGHDLYAIRDYQENDSARHVDWKASARKGSLQVKEYAREDERRVMLVFDPYIAGEKMEAAAVEQFERAVNLCAGLAWHFHEINSVLEFRSAGFGTRRDGAREIIYDILRYLASVAPLNQLPGKNFLDTLAGTQDIFKIVLTWQPRGSIPTSLWSTGYVLFMSQRLQDKLPSVVLP